MHGNLISNGELIELVQRHLIDIKPFEPERAQLAHYPLDPESFLSMKDGRWVAVHSFSNQTEPFTLKAGEYVIVEVRQHIAVSDGFVGLFIPSSNLIEQGLSLTAGKISFPFGQSNERIRFGLRNNMAAPVTVKPGDLVAYIQFYDLTKSLRRPYALSERDMKVFERRRQIAADDGVWATYDQDTDAPV